MNSVKIKRTQSSNSDFVSLIAQLDQDLSARNLSEQKKYHKHNKIQLIDTVVVAYNNGNPIGCGCFKHFDNETAEIKRMFVSSDSRGKGISKIVLKELEDWAFESGFSKVILETGKKQPEAIGLYEKYGYKRINNYGQYVDFPNSVCFEKILTGL